MNDRRIITVWLSWKVVGDPEWCNTCHHNTRLWVEGVGYTEDGFLGKTLKASYCEHCAGGNDE